MDSLITEKKMLRNTMMQERDNMPAAVKAVYDSIICDRLETLIQERDARVVHSYLPMGSEVDVFPLLEYLLSKGITIVSPKTMPARQLENLVLHSITDLETGKWGTHHPANSTVYTGVIDFFIVPGLAFDRHHYRLGYGKGYYDTHLATQPLVYKAGVCYPFQVIDKVPIETHDVQLDEVIY
ncbi:MAG: 5-formyltetrahydrofolate cyclo-ligase [Taibaiella sp.]|nr:5-formyltetrahydrofolate cyclo-ligase [Taibaiella sp.]